jgi:hypothetical protein
VGCGHAVEAINHKRKVNQIMGKIKIEKGIPLPRKFDLEGITDAMKTMAIGDSFVVPLGSRTNMKGYAIRLGIKITTRKINEKEVRVWRTQ